MLFCGDSLCEECIKRSIVRFKSSVIDPSSNIPGVLETLTQNIKEVLCPICLAIHTFRLINNGFVICNDKFVKLRDDRGCVNYYKEVSDDFEVDFKNTIQIIGKLDCPLELEDDLLVRCVPANVELIELIKERNIWQKQTNVV